MPAALPDEGLKVRFLNTEPATTTEPDGYCLCVEMIGREGSLTRQPRHSPDWKRLPAWAASATDWVRDAYALPTDDGWQEYDIPDDFRITQLDAVCIDSRQRGRAPKATAYSVRHEAGLRRLHHPTVDGLPPVDSIFVSAQVVLLPDMVGEESWGIARPYLSGCVIDDLADYVYRRACEKLKPVVGWSSVAYYRASTRMTDDPREVGINLWWHELDRAFLDEWGWAGNDPRAPRGDDWEI